MTRSTANMTAYSAMSWPVSVQRRTNKEVITISFGQKRNGGIVVVRGEMAG
jgi:hypothetical protein